MLTPHDREFERIAGGPPGADRVAAAAPRRPSRGRAAQGQRDLVAEPDGRVLVNPTGTPALATAGTGDVLAGLLGSLLAAGCRGTAAARRPFVHGLPAGSRRAGPVTAAGVAAHLGEAGGNPAPLTPPATTR